MDLIGSRALPFKGVFIKIIDGVHVSMEVTPFWFNFLDILSTMVNHKI